MRRKFHSAYLSESLSYCFNDNNRDFFIADYDENKENLKSRDFPKKN